MTLTNFGTVACMHVLGLVSGASRQLLNNVMSHVFDCGYFLCSIAIYIEVGSLIADNLLYYVRMQSSILYPIIRNAFSIPMSGVNVDTYFNLAVIC